MIIKSPPVYDISFWEEILDFSALSPRPVLMITKATESTFITDPTFVRYFRGMREAGIPRGCYHFFRKAYSSNAQAAHFLSVVEPYITISDLLILDVEEEGVSAAQMWAWFELVKQACPHNPFMLYSRKELLDRISMTAAQKAYFKLIPTWTAGYPDFPDNFSTVPPAYIPDQTKYGETLLWQYSDAGRVSGVDGAVDVNWISPKLISVLPVTEPPTEGETMSQWYRVNADALNIRKGPGTSYQDIGDLLRNQVVEIVEASGGWGRINAIYDGTTPLFVPDPASSWCSMAYLVATSAPVTPPPPPAEHTVTLKSLNYSAQSGVIHWDAVFTIDGADLPFSG